MRRLYTDLAVFLLLSGTSLTLSGQDKSGMLLDPRDGKQYRTIEIGSQVWMAQNLDFGEHDKACYDHNPENCSQYGGLYTWEAANQVCPGGWHLPSREEWEELAGHLGIDDAGQKMKSSGDDPIPWDGTNESGFSALPSGAGNGEGFHRMGDWALFWSSTESEGQRAWFAQLDGYWYRSPPKYKNLYVGRYYLKSNQFSVRCIKDQDR